VYDDAFEGFEWDDEKSDKNEAERGFDFEFASRVFDGPYYEKRQVRNQLIEPRFSTVGEVDGFHVHLVWTPRPPYRRILHARPAKKKEIEKYNGYCKTTKQFKT
jgi:uncharacterized protein